MTPILEPVVQSADPALSADRLVAAAANAAAALSAAAAAHDADRSFPADAFAVLHQAGLMTATLPADLGGWGLGGPGLRHALYRVLAHVGRGSLPVGRLYEGHVNALALVMAYGTEPQRARAADDAHAGHIFGVWNTGGGDDVTLAPLAGGGAMLHGAKTFCSGADPAARVGRAVTRAFANGAWTASGDPRDGGWQMVLVSLEGQGDRVVPDSWPAEGMRASSSGRVVFEGMRVPSDALIGAPGDYLREPDFNGGAVRFAAVHVGGAEALLEAATAMLRSWNRTADPHQRRRLGEAAIAVETGHLWLLGAARLWEQDADADAIVAYARMARTAIERVCLDVLERVDRSVGARGLLAPHPIERIGRDLRLYLRQPAPDATLDAVGAATLDTPSLLRGSAVSRPPSDA